MTNEQDTINLQILFGCGKLIVGEWSLDELVFNQKNKEMTSSSTSINNTTSPIMSETIMSFDKKEKASYCYNQIVSLICAPLKINHATLQNHSFALSIFDSLASIAAGDILNEDESVCKIAISWIWHYVKMQIKRRSKEHTREMHSVIVAAYNCLIMLLITKPNLLRDKSTLQTVTNCIEIGISGLLLIFITNWILKLIFNKHFNYELFLGKVLIFYKGAMNLSIEGPNFFQQVSKKILKKDF